ncbi:MAG TPA: alpha/beta hydrolase-fold protein [Anaerolineales bacterium]|nr:alpha/beta hydrolase-fold protein [Anaerolineales bacterium]
METACALSHTTRIWISTLHLAFGALTACSPLGSAPPPMPGNTPLPEETATARGVDWLPTVSSTAAEALTGTAATSATAALTANLTPILNPTPAPLLCLTQGGKITQHTLSTPLSPQPWEFRVYTPPCYEQQTDQRYPLLILIHGTAFTDDQWDRLGADETADALIGAGEIPPFLILMPRDWYWTYEPFYDPFGEALVEYLLPWMDENYRTLPGREHRAIGGLSRGASWAVHLGILHWELFSAVGGHSLPVFPSDPTWMQQWIDEIPRESVPRFFLDIGENDNLLEKALWFENLLNENNISHEWYLNLGNHDEAYWKTHLEQYLRWYAEQWSHLH